VSELQHDGCTQAMTVACPSCQYALHDVCDNDALEFCPVCGLQLGDGEGELVHGAPLPSWKDFRECTNIVPGADNGSCLVPGKFPDYASPTLLALERQLVIADACLSLGGDSSAEALAALRAAYATCPQRCGRGPGPVIIAVAIFAGSRNAGAPVTLRSVCRTLGASLHAAVQHYVAVRGAVERARPSVRYKAHRASHAPDGFTCSHRISLRTSSE
jgi:hypothetical protein